MSLGHIIGKNMISLTNERTYTWYNEPQLIIFCCCKFYVNTFYMKRTMKGRYSVYFGLLSRKHSQYICLLCSYFLDMNICLSMNKSQLYILCCIMYHNLTLIWKKMRQGIFFDKVLPIHFWPWTLKNQNKS